MAMKPMQERHPIQAGQQTADPSAAVTVAHYALCKARTFVGPTTMYAFMQAMGLVNDHLEGCASRQACATVKFGSVGLKATSCSFAGRIVPPEPNTN